MFCYHEFYKLNVFVVERNGDSNLEDLSKTEESAIIDQKENSEITLCPETSGKNVETENVSHFQFLFVFFF